MVRSFFPPNCFRICIDEEETALKGRVLSPLSAEPILFYGIGEMILHMDEMFDRAGYPQAFQNRRSFLEPEEAINAYRGIPKKVQEDDYIASQRGAVGTFDVLLKSRMNTTWQGVLYGEDQTVLLEFNSELEFAEGFTRQCEFKGKGENK